MTIVVGTTTAAYRMTGDVGYWSAWLDNWEAVRDSVDEDVVYFLAVETDARGATPFLPLLDRLGDAGGDFWSFSLNCNEPVITTGNRLKHICFGQNLVGEYAMETGASHVLFLATDTRAPDDVLPRLLELNAPVAACHIPTYCMGLDVVAEPEFAAQGWDVRAHMETCACMLLSREVFRQIKWRTDGDAGMSDDPCMHRDVGAFLGYRVLSRHDVQAVHYPESIPAIEDRHSDAQRAWVR